MNPYLAKLAARSPAYAATFRGEKVPSPAGPRRPALCLSRGQLIGPRTGCTGNDLHACDRYGSVIAHNRQCQTCDGYEPDV